MFQIFRTSAGGLDELLHRPQRSWWQQFIDSPQKTLACTIYSFGAVQSRQHARRINVICISDTHNKKLQITHGDLLIHAGDLSVTGSIEEIQAQLDWLKSLPHEHKVFIAGNHDKAFESEEERKKLDWEGLIYLQDSSTEISFSNGRKFSIYGNPWTKKQGNWSFQYPSATTDFWTSKIPIETDILITHMAPRFHLDVDGWGDQSLLRELHRIRPSLHVFGHFHAGYGKDYVVFDAFERAYEAARTGNWKALWDMVYHLFVSRLIGRQDTGTWSVNAASFRGLRDDVLQFPIRIDL